MQDGEVGGTVDPARCIPWGQLDVGNDLVGRVVWVDGQVDDAVNLPVGAGIAENGAAGEGSDGVDFQSGDCHGQPP